MATGLELLFGVGPLDASYRIHGQLDRCGLVPQLCKADLEIFNLFRPQSVPWEAHNGIEADAFGLRLPR